MTHFAKRCELEALVTEREKMVANDAFCSSQRLDGQHLATDYDDLAARMRALADDSTAALDPTPVTCADPCGCEESEELQRKLSDAQAEVASLQALACTQRDCLGEANATVERLKQELTSVREQLPEWAVPVMRAVRTYYETETHAAARNLCRAWEAFPSHQRQHYFIKEEVQP
jgi:hypothetical protein